MFFQMLLNNITLLVTLVVAHNVIMHRWKTETGMYRVLSGFLFGTVAVIGMLNPVPYLPGLIFDGRSIILCVSGLFGGPVTAGIAAVMCAVYRLHLGGIGAVMGVSVIASASAWGVLFHYLRRRRPHVVGMLWMYFLGVLVHVTMITLMLTLPGATISNVYRHIALPVITIYPLATLLLGMILVDQEQRLKEVEAQRQQEERLHRLAENVPGAIYEFYARKGTGEMGLRYASGRITDIFGDLGGLDGMFERLLQRMPSEDAERMLASIRDAVEQEKHWEFEGRFQRADGRTIWFRGMSSPSRFGDELVFYGVILDVTDRVRSEEERAVLEEQLRQSQKMEAIGLLAGGVAHDLNNLLSPILGYADMLLLDPKLDEQLRGQVQEILSVSEKARDLVRQLTAFGRKQTLEIRPLDLNEIVSSFSKLLRRTLREDIRIDLKLAPGLNAVAADRGQIEQVVMNLAVNARDAIPQDGVLTISTEEIAADEAFVAKFRDMGPGRYICLTVSDSGTGMTEEVAERVFEPFFTTKEQGKGVGLGLAMVYGIVRQHGGFIRVESEPGKGATFQICLPSLGGVAVAEPVEVAETLVLPQGKETILVAEDEPIVRGMVCSMLENLGYTVIESSDVASCVALAQEHGDRIQLLLTDVIMPELNGKALYERLRAIVPGLKVLYMSGYTADFIAHHGVVEEDLDFIQKPFSRQALARKLRDIF